MIEDTLEEKILQDHYLVMNGQLLQHRLRPFAEVTLKINNNFVIENLIFCLEQLSKANFKVSQIEVPALTRIIKKHIFNDEISLPTALNYAKLIKFYSLWSYVLSN